MAVESQMNLLYAPGTAREYLFLVPKYQRDRVRSPYFCNGKRTHIVMRTTIQLLKDFFALAIRVLQFPFLTRKRILRSLDYLFHRQH